MSLIEAGAVTNKYKQINRYKNVFNLAAGSQALYEVLHGNPSMECHPAEYANDPYIIGMNGHVLSVNAEFLHHHQYTAPGGQLDFARGAALSEGGVSIIAGHALADHGRSSRIVPRLEVPVTAPRMDMQCIVTEYGVCDLRGKSTTGRALGLIAIPHRPSVTRSWTRPRSLGTLADARREGLPCPQAPIRRRSSQGRRGGNSICALMSVGLLGPLAAHPCWGLCRTLRELPLHSGESQHGAPRT